MAPKLYFFYKGTRLSRKLTTLELLEKQLQRGTRRRRWWCWRRRRRSRQWPLERCLEFLGVTKIPVELAYYAEKVKERKIEYEREKQRKLSEVYLVGFHRTQDCQFYVKDMFEYIRSALTLQLGVGRLLQRDKQLLELGTCFASRATLTLALKSENVERGLFVVQTLALGELQHDHQAHLAQLLLQMQLLNLAYRKQVRKVYKLREPLHALAHPALNNALCGALTDGVTWLFLHLSQHGPDRLHVRLLHRLQVHVSNFFLDNHALVQVIVNLLAKLVFQTD